MSVNINLKATIKFNVNMENNYASIGGFTGVVDNTREWNFDFLQFTQLALPSDPTTVEYRCFEFDGEYSEVVDPELAVLIFDKLTSIEDIYIDTEGVEDVDIYPLECTELEITIYNDKGGYVKRTSFEFDLASPCIDKINTQWKKEYMEAIIKEKKGE